MNQPNDSNLILNHDIMILGNGNNKASQTGFCVSVAVSMQNQMFLYKHLLKQTNKQTSKRLFLYLLCFCYNLLAVSFCVGDSTLNMWLKCVLYKYHKLFLIILII
jgi:hypothetical protein